MASLSYEQDRKRWRIQFFGPDGNRRSFDVKGSEKARRRAQTVLGMIEELISAAMTRTACSRTTAVWVSVLPDETHQQLASYGLVEPRAVSMELGPFLEEWFREREKSKKSTLTVWGHARRNLLAFFTPQKKLREITEEDAERFERWLKEDQKLSEATIRKRCGFSKQFLESAVKDRLLERNPLASLKVTAVGNKQRQFFVAEDMVRKVLKACPDAEWRLLVGLSRYAALRCPSEAFELKWKDIDSGKGRIQVHASKTEHHADGGNRQVPLFVELRPLLDEVRSQAPKGSEYVLDRIRSHKNIGTKLRRIIAKAGLKPWPKPFHNMRATRCTELERKFSP